MHARHNLGTQLERLRNSFLAIDEIQGRQSIVSKVGGPQVTRKARNYTSAPWHFLYFLPEPHGHGSLRPTLSPVRR